MLLGLVVILIGAKLGGEAAERLGQPAVLGEILVGILFGNLGLVGIHFLDFLPRHEWLHALSELGVILLLFEVGLICDLNEMRRVGLSALLVALVGVIVPMLLGIGVARAFLPQASPLVWLFIGATLCATSVGITARVLRDLGRLQRPEARIILGAAVIDDVLGLVVLAVVGGIISATSRGVGLGGAGLAVILVKALGFLVGAILLAASGAAAAPGGLVTQRPPPSPGRQPGFCFLLSWLAAQMELAPIVGAFAAGLVLDPVHYQNFGIRGSTRWKT